ncbi:MAG: CYCXC family (seleno)protein [Pyrinomonadaceae bacterium]
MKAMKKINLALACGLLLAVTLLLQACGSSAPYATHSTSGTPAAETPATSSRQTEQTASHAGHGDGAGEATAAAGAAADPHAGHAHGAPGRVPRFAKSNLELKSLPPVLSAAQFTGKTRMAYAAVKEMPETIAQLPCYCHCDEGFGHKSLQTCFVDDHAAHCAVCVEEALLAHKLQKDEGLSPAQIRERIIATYGAAQ